MCCVVVCDLETSRMGAPYIYIYDISRLRVNITEFLYFIPKVYWYLFPQRELSAWSLSLRISIFYGIVSELLKLV